MNQSSIDLIQKLCLQAYKKHDPKTKKKELLLACKQIHALEQNGDPNDFAEKLDLLFDSVYIALSTVEKLMLSQKKSFHDILQFKLPLELSCNFAMWRKIIARNLHNAQFMKYLNNIPKIEELLNSDEFIKSIEHKFNIKIIDASPMLIKQKAQEISTLKNVLRPMKKRHGSLSHLKKKEYSELNNKLALLNLELAMLACKLHTSKPKALSMTPSVFLALNQAYIITANPDLKYMLANGLTADDHYKFSKLDRTKAGLAIPDIKIDCTEIGHPGYYIMKVPVATDKAQAIRAAFLGKLTNCCQSLSGETGEPCVIHGLTSPNGGFYVLCKGNISNPQVTDKVIAQSWAWRSKNDAIVFDSIETIRAEHAKLIAQDAFHRLGFEICENKHGNKAVTVVMNGSSVYGVSKLVGINTILYSSQEPLDYPERGYRDSKCQNFIADAKNPFFLSGLLCSIERDFFFPNSILRFVKLLDKSGVKDKLSQSLIEVLAFCLNSNFHADHNDFLLQDIERSYPQLKPKVDTLRKYLSRETDNKAAYELALSNLDELMLINRLGQSLLMQAVKFKDIKNIKKLVSMGADVNFKSTRDSVLLHAVSIKFYPAIEYLLTVDSIDVNMKPQYHKSALSHAVTTKDLQAVKLLLAHPKINVNILCGRYTMLMIAAFTPGSAIIIKELLKHPKIDVNCTDGMNGSTALMCVVDEENARALLTAKNIDIEIENKHGYTAIMAAKNRSIRGLLEDSLKSCSTGVERVIEQELQQRSSHTALARPK